jgi:hypothetical protein
LRPARINGGADPTVASHRCNACERATERSTSIGSVRTWNIENNEDAWGSAFAPPTFTILLTVSTMTCAGGLFTIRRRYARARAKAVRRPLECASDPIGSEKPAYDSSFTSRSKIVTSSAGAVAEIWGPSKVNGTYAEKISSWRVDRDIKLLQREKLKRELVNTNPNAADIVEKEASFRHVLQVREAAYYYDRTGERLEKGSIRITEFDVSIIRGLPPKGPGEG